jgi:hypothetical protein
MKTGYNLIKSSKEGYGSKRNVSPVVLIQNGRYFVHVAIFLGQKVHTGKEYLILVLIQNGRYFVHVAIFLGQKVHTGKEYLILSTITTCF